MTDFSPRTQTPATAHRATATYDNISDDMRELVDAIHAEGLDAYMRECRDTWVVFTDGTNIGYAQIDRLRGITFSTKHIPNASVGNGYTLQDETFPTLAHGMRAAFAFAPSWARSYDLPNVKKWKDWPTFHAKDTFSRAYVKIEKPEDMTAEQEHAAFDLAQYTINTSALYPKAQEIMQQRAAGRYSDKLWLGHVKNGRTSYQKEMGSDDHTELFFLHKVVAEAARQIKEHYAEEQAEITA